MAQTRVNEETAARYAQKVYRVLVDAGVVKEGLKRIILEEVGRQAEAPMSSFQLIVDDMSMANWRLLPDLNDARRVQVGCFRLKPSAADDAREDSINAALRAIELER